LHGRKDVQSNEPGIIRWKAERTMTSMSGIVAASCYSGGISGMCMYALIGLCLFIAGFLFGRISRRRGFGGSDNQATESDVGCELYVGNLPYETTDEELNKLFAEYGKVISARVIMNRSSGTSKGYGFVTMVDESAAHDAIEGLRSREVKGRRIAVNEARTRPRDRQE